MQISCLRLVSLQLHDTTPSGGKFMIEKLLNPFWLDDFALNDVITGPVVESD